MLELYSISKIFPRQYSEYDAAIKGAVRASHENLALLLLQGRNLYPPDVKAFTTASFESSVEDQFWCELLQVAASRNCEGIAKFVLDTTAIVSWTGSLNLPLEDASRYGYAGIVRLLLSRCSVCSLTSYTAPLYWAARGGYLEILDMLLGGVASGDFNGFVDALCGAVFHGKDVTSHILDLGAAYSGEDKRRNWPVTTGSTGFAKMVDSLLDSDAPSDFTSASRSSFGEMVARRSNSLHICEEDDMMSYGLPYEVKLMKSACKSGSLAAIQNILSDWKSQDQSNSLEVFSGCFSTAASNERPGVLLYLCEKIPQYLCSEAALDARSTAIFQVFLDRGWNINQVFHRLMPPPLG